MFALSNSSNILFSEKVVLAEGKTENRLIPFLIETVTGRSLGLNKCALVQQGGSGNTKKSLQVLEVMDLPSKAIVDLDFVFKQAVDDGFLQNSDPDLQACLTEIARIAPLNNINLGDDGLPTKRNSSMTASEAFALLAKSQNVQANIENLKTKLQGENIWIWKKGTIENHLNIQGKNEGVWTGFVQEVENDDIETALPNDHQEIRDCVNWLLN